MDESASNLKTQVGILESPSVLMPIFDFVNGYSLVIHLGMTGNLRVSKKIKYLKRFEVVKKKLKGVEDQDRIKNWQPPINGKEIMDIFKIQPCKEVGVLKDLIKNAILDGVIKNDYKQAKKYLFIKAKELGINEK